MIKKIVHINYQPISPKYYSDFYLEECLDNGFDVEYWDISKLYFPNVKFIESNNFNTTVLKISSFKGLKSALLVTNIESALFITNLTYEFRVLKLFRILTIFDCNLACFARGVIPSPEKNISSKVANVILSFSLRRIMSAFKSRVAILLKKYKIIKNYDFIFRAGSKGSIAIGAGYEYDLKAAKVIEINYVDYDKYLKVQNETRSIEHDYCVFLDVYLPHHPDIQITNIDTVDAELYYSQLNNYFDYIEKTYNLNVVICAHPKAIKYQSENPFSGRKIVFNQTCEFVKDAKFAMTNYSTSMSFPILFRKPIFFITCEAEKEKMFDLHETTLYFGIVLNSRVTHFDKIEFENISELTIDEELYTDYLYKYLTSEESNNRFSSDIFIETILKL